MKTLLVFPPTSNPAPSYFGPPYGLALLGAILDRAGQGVAAIDYDRVGLEAMLADIPAAVARERPDLIGISCLSINRGTALQAARAFKAAAPHIPIVFGGPFPTLEPALMLRQSPAELVCVGDGDETLLELVQAMEAGRDLAEVPGLMIKRGDELLSTPKRPRFNALDTLPFPKIELFPTRAVLDQFRQQPQRDQLARLRVGARAPYVSDAMFMVMTSRGCPWNCNFCPLSTWEGNSIHFSPAYVVAQIKHCVEHLGYRSFVFGDNTLTHPRKNILEICDRLIEADLGVEWICMTRADMVDDEVLQKMAAAGCKEISFGVESLNLDVQRQVKKRLAPKRVPDAIERTQAAGISTCLMLMVGNKGETRDTLRDSSGKLRGIQPDRILINTTKVYPGTRLWDAAVTEGVIPPDYYDREDTEAPFYTGENSAAELKHLETMLQHRTTYIPAPHAAPTAEVEKDLLMAAWRGEHCVFGGGGDPLLRPDLLQLLRFAQARQVHRLRLFTPGAALVSPAVREALLGSGLIDGVIVPVWSTHEGEHDQRVGQRGALRATRKGLVAWTRKGGKVQVWAFLDRRTTPDAAGFVTWLHEHGVKDVLFIYGEAPAGWGEVPAAELPPLADAGRALRAAADRARALGVELSTSGVPECLLGQGSERVRIHELGRPFDERVDPGQAPVALAPRRAAARGFLPACEACRMRPGCEGLRLDRLELDGPAVQGCPDSWVPLRAG
jgi:radical SAM superfamily enzyme YgiQ (UPF0313 family)